MNNIIIIVPCYNEFKRLDKNRYLDFLNKNKNCTIIFSNDGSSDDTLKVLKTIQKEHKNNVIIYSTIANKGKAEATREAVLYCYTNNLNFEKIAYLDADLSTSLQECLLVSNTVKDNILFAFGSRISKIDNTIIRKKFRHYSGRFVATIISNILNLPVYDTQCGCKVFEAKIAKRLFEKKFISKWLFDVEIFFRLKNLYSESKIKSNSREVPLISWIDVDDSKVKLSYFFKMWKDIYIINKQYNAKNK